MHPYLQKLRPHAPLFFPLLLIAGFLAYATAISWTHEDIDITARVVDNVLNGYGLRWNIDERVQVYTHPLWLLLLIPASGFYYLMLPLPAPGLPSFLAIYYAHCTLSVMCLTAMLALLLYRFRKNPVLFALLIMLPLFSCTAFMDYATSGFENPLSYLLITLMADNFYNPPARNTWFLRSLIFGLLMFNRMDLALLFGFTFAVSLWPQRHILPIKPLAIGAIPFVAWCAFAQVYYGFILPNTYYAKVSSSFTHAEYIKNGLLYFTDFARSSPVGVLMLLLNLGLATVLAPKWRAHKVSLSLIAGVLLYFAYVINVGGDYISGRLFTTPFCLATLVFAFETQRSPHSFRVPAIAMLFATCLSTQPWVPSRTLHYTESPDITNEHMLRDGTCLFCDVHHEVEEEEWSREGRQRRANAEAFHALKPDEPYIVVLGSVGLIGLFSGPQVTAIDHLRLCDAFLSRLAVIAPYRPGHFLTEPPPGYIEARRTGDSSSLPPELREYYDAMRLVTAGPIWSWDRFKAIVALNTGMYHPETWKLAP